ncbi:MAG: helix-turn-helix domain-containing protein [Crocosphaera sp.]|nr:helix-turn-helix domain-containing protein [Crocosphaera sp.]
MYITAKETANILGVSQRRVLFLLSENRIEGAFKAGNQWLIPLCDGKPIIREGKRGPKPRWSGQVKKPRKKDLTVIKVIRTNIDGNAKHNTNKTVISVKRGNEPTIYGHCVTINGPSKIHYSHEARKDKGGARVWVETYFDFDVVVEQDLRLLNSVYSV